MAGRELAVKTFLQSTRGGIGESSDVVMDLENGASGKLSNAMGLQLCSEL